MADLRTEIIDGIKLSNNGIGIVNYETLANLPNLNNYVKSLFQRLPNLMEQIISIQKFLLWIKIVILHLLSILSLALRIYQVRRLHSAFSLTDLMDSDYGTIPT